MEDITNVGIVFDHADMAKWITASNYPHKMSHELDGFLTFINDVLDEINITKFKLNSNITLTIQHFEILIKYGNYLKYEIDYNQIKSCIRCAENIEQVIQIFRDGQLPFTVIITERHKFYPIIIIHPGDDDRRNEKYLYCQLEEKIYATELRWQSAFTVVRLNI